MTRESASPPTAIARAAVAGTVGGTRPRPAPRPPTGELGEAYVTVAEDVALAGPALQRREELPAADAVAEDDAEASGRHDRQPPR